MFPLPSAKSLTCLSNDEVYLEFYILQKGSKEMVYIVSLCLLRHNPLIENTFKDGVPFNISCEVKNLL